MGRKAIIAQSGGPSPVINASLQGVIEALGDYNDHIDGIYGAWHGIEGVLKEEIIDLNKEKSREISLLRYTPAAGAIGTCRYKLKGENDRDFKRIIEVLRAHDIGYFFYIGGNDSMDTAQKVSDLARSMDYDLVVTGVPKTIDNDVGDQEFKLIDHTPGYGSTARYWANIIQNINEENRGINVSESVAVIQAMGRKSGFITAAARLGDVKRRMPLLLFMAECNHNLESLAEGVNDCLKENKRCMVVVNEGFDAGDIGEAYDGFGHVEYGASRMAAGQKVVNYLNEKGLAARGQATFQLPGILQRSVSHLASKVDIDEAYRVGRHAVEIALKEGTGFMATILRKDCPHYEVFYSKVKLEDVANSVRFIPEKWIAENRMDVTDDFIRYALPLIGDGNPPVVLEGGIQRFARFELNFIDKKLKDYRIS